MKLTALSRLILPILSALLAACSPDAGDLPTESLPGEMEASAAATVENSEEQQSPSPPQPSQNIPDAAEPVAKVPAAASPDTPKPLPIAEIRARIGSFTHDEFDALAATAEKRGGQPPQRWDYDHGVTQAGDVAALREAIASAQAGDVIEVPRGVYHDVGQLELAADGTSDGPIRLRASEPGGAVFMGRSNILVTGDYWEVSGLLFDHAVFQQPQPVLAVRGAQGVRVTNCAFLSSGVENSKYVPLIEWAEGARDGRVDHCTFYDFIGMGVKVRVGPQEADTAKNIRIDHNHFRDVLRRHKNGGECVQIGQNPMKYGRLESAAVIENNLFERADGDGEVISNKSSGNILRNNRFIGCGGALWLRGGQGCEVTGNTWQGGSSGIVVYGKGHTILENVIQGTHSYAIIAQYGSDWENVGNAGLSYEALNESSIRDNTIIDPKVRGLVYGAFRNDDSAHLVNPPTGNTVTGNIIAGQSGTLLIAEEFGETEFESNWLLPDGRAAAGSSVSGFKIAGPDQQPRELPQPDQAPRDIVGTSWIGNR